MSENVGGDPVAANPAVPQLPALITGASKGIGAALARVFARNGHPVALAARSSAQLHALAAELERDFRVRTVVASLNLEIAGASLQLKRQLDEAGFAPGILVNNAGYGLMSRFEEQRPADQLGIIDLNCRMLTELTGTFLPQIISARGKILNVASTAAFYAGPGAAIYYASKAYVLSLSRALGHELKPHGVSVTALCPGPVRTGFFDRAGAGRIGLKGLSVMEPMPVAEAGYRAMVAGRRHSIPGFQNRLLASVSGLTPQWIALPFVGMLQMQRRK